LSVYRCSYQEQDLRPNLIHVEQRRLESEQEYYLQQAVVWFLFKNCTKDQVFEKEISGFYV